MAEFVVLVNGLPGSGKTTLATALARALAVPLISKDAIKEALAEAVPGVGPHLLGPAAAELMWTLASEADGVVLESWWFKPRDLGFVEAGLRRCGGGAAGIVEIWCDVPPELARERFGARRRHPVHRDEQSPWPEWVRGAEPLGVGRTLRVRTDAPVDVGGLVHRITG